MVTTCGDDMTKNKKDSLSEKLLSLRKLADEQSTHYRRSHELLYIALSRTYMWWASASQEKGLLEELYKEHGIQYKKVIRAAVNFSPLLRYLWQMDGAEDSATIDQWNRTLNKIHLEYQGNKEFYKVNTEARLIAFITTSGGISKLAAYSSSFAEGEAELTKRKKRVDVNLERKRQSAHLDRGKSFFANSAAAIASFDTTKTLPTGNGDIAVGLIKRTRTGYSLIGVVDDASIVDELIIKAYARDTADAPFTIRYLAEVLKTQLVPIALQKIARSLNEPSKMRDENGKPIFRLRRLLYMSKEKVFVLSSTRGTASVVTISYPNQKIIEAKENCYLVINDRNFIEEEILYANDINLFTTDHPYKLEIAKNESATHKLFLVNSVTQKSRYIRFNPISSYTSSDARKQALLKRGVSIRPYCTVTVDKAWLVEMYGSFLSKWINGFGPAMRRKEYSVICLAFGRQGLKFQFVQRGDSYDDFEVIPYGERRNIKPLSVEVLSKDIVSVLNYLYDSEAIGKITIDVEPHIIRFTVRTEVATHLIFVPTCTRKGQRNESLFEAYEG